MMKPNHTLKGEMVLPAWLICKPRSCGLETARPTDATASFQLSLIFL